MTGVAGMRRGANAQALPVLGCVQASRPHTGKSPCEPCRRFVPNDATAAARRARLAAEPARQAEAAYRASVAAWQAERRGDAGSAGAAAAGGAAGRGVHEPDGPCCG